MFAEIASGLGSVASSAIDAWSAHQQQKFQQHMSDTAHQREVRDLRAAGLNPILSATGGSGASTPSGTSFSVENPVSSALDAYYKMQDIKNQTDLKESQTKNVDAQTQSIVNTNSAFNLRFDLEVQQAKANIYNAVQQGKLFPLQAKSMLAQIDNYTASSAKTRYETGPQGSLSIPGFANVQGRLDDLSQRFGTSSAKQQEVVDKALRKYQSFEHSGKSFFKRGSFSKRY